MESTPTKNRNNNETVPSTIIITGDHQVEYCSVLAQYANAATWDRSASSSSSFLFSLGSLTLYILYSLSVPPNPHSFPLCKSCVPSPRIYSTLCPQLSSPFPLGFHKYPPLPFVFLFPKCPHQSPTLPAICRYKIMTLIVSFNSKLK